MRKIPTASLLGRWRPEQELVHSPVLKMKIVRRPKPSLQKRRDDRVLMRNIRWFCATSATAAMHIQRRGGEGGRGTRRYPERFAGLWRVGSEDVRAKWEFFALVMFVLVMTGAEIGGLHLYLYEHLSGPGLVVGGAGVVGLLLFCLSILAFSLCRLWRRTF
jgi:hypothetical protein